MIDELRALAESNGLTIIDASEDKWKILGGFNETYETILILDMNGVYQVWCWSYAPKWIKVSTAQQVVNIAKGIRDDGPKQSMDDTRARGKRTVDGVIDALERIIAELESIEEDCKIHRMGYCDGAVELARNAACHSLDLAMLFKSSRKPQT